MVLIVRIDTVRTQRWLLSNPNVLVAIIKGMQAIKLCSNNIFQLFTGGPGVPANTG